jgi:hypothetical protein
MSGFLQTGITKVISIREWIYTLAGPAFVCHTFTGLPIRIFCDDNFVDAMLL